jgi:phospholipid/cholesterol/gamma-HCH transport system substrate-binding protein
MKKEYLIGILFLLAIASIGYVTAVVQNFNPFRESHDIVVVFNRINGLKKENQVLYSGSHIGYVKKIRFNEDHMIEVTLSIKNLENVDIPQNASITIEDTTVLGGKQISITRPTLAPIKARRGHIYKGRDPSPLLKNAGKALEQITEGFEGLTDLLKGQGTIPRLFKEDQLLIDLKKSFKNLGDIAEKINTDKGAEGGMLSQILHDPKPFNDLKKFIGKLDRVHINLNAEYRAFPEDKYSVSNIGARLETDVDKFYDIGASIFSTNHETQIATDRIISRQKDTVAYANVQIGRRFLERNNLELSAGLLEGEVGGKASFYVDMPRDRIGFHFEGRSRIRDKNIRENNSNLMARMYLNYERQFDSFPTLHVSAGVHNVFDDAQGFGAVGFSFRDDDLKYLISALSGGS